MNQSVAVLLIAWAAAAALWAVGRAVIGARAQQSGVAVGMLGIAVLAWLATGFVSWAADHPPARPWVFVGYAAVAAVILPVGTPLTGRLRGRSGDLTRAVLFGLVAFLCYRAEVMYL